MQCAMRTLLYPSIRYTQAVGINTKISINKVCNLLEEANLIPNGSKNALYRDPRKYRKEQHTTRHGIKEKKKYDKKRTFIHSYPDTMLKEDKTRRMKNIL